MAPPKGEVVRLEPCPEQLKLQIRMRHSQAPELSEWIWKRPYRASAAIKVVLERALRSGELDAAEREITNAQDGT